ncbi:hypothetical protein GCM10010214_12990 [Streptomyces abikoensis]|nr:hypothetical protein GCM10010214_12990 [Streptomyces abikoensis]
MLPCSQVFSDGSALRCLGAGAIRAVEVMWAGITVCLVGWRKGRAVKTGALIAAIALTGQVRIRGET